MLHFNLHFPLSDPIAPEMALPALSAQGLGFALGSEKQPPSETHMVLRADPNQVHSEGDE